MSPSDALEILEYDQADYFVERYSKIRRKQRLQDRLDRVEDYRRAIESSSGKTGHQQYIQWRHGVIAEIKEPLDRVKTIFEQLREQKTETLFDRLRRGG